MCPSHCWVRQALPGAKSIPAALPIKTNAGVGHTNLKGDLPGYPEPVWFYPNGIANILSMAGVRKLYRITYDCDEKYFAVHKPDGDRYFRESSGGLYYYNTEQPQNHRSAMNITPSSNHRSGNDRGGSPPRSGGSNNSGSQAAGTTGREATQNRSGAGAETALVNTVAENKARYSKRDYARAELARSVHNIIGRPALQDYLQIIDGNLLPNCPVTRADIKAAEDIFGPNLGCLKGKTVRRAGEPVEIRTELVPLQIKQRYRVVTIAVDIMFVNKLPFLMTLSEGIKFGTLEHLNSRQEDVIGSAVERVQHLYKLRGFDVKFCKADEEFEAIRDILRELKIDLNTAAQNEHIAEIERYNRVVKERARGAVNTLPFRSLPIIMIRELIYLCVRWLNTFPPSGGGVSTTLSPRVIVTGRGVDYNAHCQLEYGEYVQTHEEHSNDMGSRTIGAIALGPSGNSQRGYHFMSLSTGKRLHRYKWTKLPMPDDVIDRVHQIARRQKAAVGLTFGDRHGIEMLDDDNADDVVTDPDYDPTADDEAYEDEADDGSDDEHDDEEEVVEPEECDDEEEVAEQEAVEDENGIDIAFDSGGEEQEEDLDRRMSEESGLYSKEDPQDPTSCHSWTGYVVTLGNNPIYWASSLQTKNCRFHDVCRIHRSPQP